MGVNLKDLLIRKEIEISDLKNKIIVFDGFNILYQFLSSIRAPDGSFLTDSHGNVTSHLIGLFSRTCRFLEHGIKPVFVFDGEVPELKRAERERRKAIKIEAQKKFAEAVKKEDIEEMRKFAARTTVLSEDMIDSAKELLDLFGIPCIQAPSEGEAQASYMVKKGDGWAVGSQDYDSLLYGASRLIQNLSIEGKRKIKGALGYKKVSPEIIDLKENLHNLQISQDQLLILAILVGTDYNKGGIKGIGPKKALAFVKEYKSNHDALFSKVKWNDFFDLSWQDVYNTFKKMPVTDDYKLKWRSIDTSKMVDFLVKEHDFDANRVAKSLDMIKDKSPTQKGLLEF